MSFSKIVACPALATALMCSAACGHEAPPASSVPPAAGTHQHRAPHGGILVELGEEFAHVELVLDPDAGSLTAYVLDGEAEESVRLKQKSLTVALETPGSSDAQIVELPARANILTGETLGDSSEFSVALPSLIGRRSIKGRIVVVLVRGGEFRDVKF